MIKLFKQLQGRKIQQCHLAPCCTSHNLGLGKGYQSSPIFWEPQDQTLVLTLPFNGYLLMGGEVSMATIAINYSCPHANHDSSYTAHMTPLNCLLTVTVSMDIYNWTLKIALANIMH